MNEVDKYLNSLDQDQKLALQRIRSIVLTIVPESEEVISYDMPVFKYKGKYLLGYAAFKDHMSLFPGSGAVEKISKDLDGFKTSKGTIQFTLGHLVSDTLVKKIVKFRVEEIERGR